MEEQSRKWMVLVATTWIQAFTGTNFDFSSYSSDLKMVLGISQVQLNNLSVASDFGKAFGWCSGVALLYLPVWLVMFVAACIGLFGYGFQWLAFHKLIAVPYYMVFLLCLLSGCSISWFNTICYVLCIRNFPNNHARALSLTVSFNGLSAALYTLISNSIHTDDPSLYLFLNALLPFFASCFVLALILRHPPISVTDDTCNDSLTFVILNVIAVCTGLYLLLLNPFSLLDTSVARVLLTGALFLLILPLFIARVRIYGSHVDLGDIELHQELIKCDDDKISTNSEDISNYGITSDDDHYCVKSKERGIMLGEEHSVNALVRRGDFWLYYVAYFCGGTIGLVYSNNLGQISESLGFGSQTNAMVTLYASFSFFGRLLSSAPDYLRLKVYLASTGWLAAALIPMSLAFFLLASSGTESALRIGTSLIGLCSGFIFAAAVSVTSELFGPNSAGVNHNILITNIPIGSLIYGFLAARVYDANVGQAICMGRQCYLQTFVCWGCISLFGLVCSVLLFFRTKQTCDQLEKTQNRN